MRSPTSRNHFKVLTTPVSDFSVGTRRTARSSMGRTGRKTFKTDKKKQEAVWPESVEAALLDGLAFYKPPPARGGRCRGRLQRFPKRNKVIAQYIFERTGQARTAKQVGSRIQQLRQTCRDPRLFEHLTDRSRFEDADSDHTHSSTPSSPCPRALSEVSTAPSMAGLSCLDQLSAPQTPVLPPAYSLISHVVSLVVSVVDGDWNLRPNLTQLLVELDGRPTDVASTSNLTYTVPRSQLHVSPSVMVKLSGVETLAVYRNTYTVYSDGVPVNSQSFDIATYYDGTLVSQLVPEFWAEIVNDSHIHDCFVVQTIGAPDSAPQIEVTYKIDFDYQSSSPPPPPLSHPCSPSTYSSPAPMTPYSIHSQILSPIEAFDHSTLPSPSASTSFSICPSTMAYPLSLPLPSSTSYSSSTGTWSLAETTAYQLQEFAAPFTL